MPAIYEHAHRVRPAEVDPQGHASNVAFVQWLQEAALAHSAAQGWPPGAYRATGCGWVVRRHEIEYRAPAYAEQDLVVRTWVATMDKVTSLRRYEIRRPADGVVLAVASTLWAWVELASGRPRRVPAEIAAAFIVVPDDAPPAPAG